jgi:hypothetical protein
VGADGDCCLRRQAAQVHEGEEGFGADHHGEVLSQLSQHRAVGATVTGLQGLEPDRFRIDVQAMSPDQMAAMAGNRATYGGTTMADAGLLGRLESIDVPTLVVRGAADRIVPPEHGCSYADRIPGARLAVVENAGHLPQLERRNSCSPSSGTSPTPARARRHDRGLDPRCRRRRGGPVRPDPDAHPGGRQQHRTPTRHRRDHHRGAPHTFANHADEPRCCSTPSPSTCTSSTSAT